MSRLRVLSIGLGPIGLATARLALQKSSLQLVGAVDVDPGKAGKPLADLLGAGFGNGITIEALAARAIERLRPELVLLCTASYLPEIRDDLLTAVRAGAHVVSSCEELLLPDLQYPELAQELDQAARAGGVSILGTGVNPGFVLDFLPVVASAVCGRVDRVRCVRVVDATSRRVPLLRKLGVGLDPEVFRRLASQGELGHVGIRESVALLGRALDFELDSVRQEVEPVLADRQCSTAVGLIEPGSVAGIRNRGCGETGRKLRIELLLEMVLGASEPRDELFLEGDPGLHLLVEGGIPGDEATASVLVNSIRQVVDASPGLKTVLEVLPPRALP